jgi:hypothetical protein
MPGRTWGGGAERLPSKRHDIHDGALGVGYGLTAQGAPLRYCLCAVYAHTQYMSTKSPDSLDRITALLRQLPEETLDRVEVLGEVRELLDELLNESMAQATLKGASIRAVALRAGLSPNAVPPRLARTEPLQAYSSPDGRVIGSGIERARYDAEQNRTPPASTNPPRFQKRRPTPGDTP